MNTGASMDEAREFLARNPDIRHIQLMLTDANGVLRGKSVRPDELTRVYAQGMPLPSSIAALTLNGDDAENTGLLWEIGDMDCLAFPVPGTLVRCPWVSAPTAQALLMFDAQRGQPAAAADPRLVASRVVAGLERAGYTAVIAVELEFYLLDAASLGEHPPRPALARGHHPHVYSIDEVETLTPFFDQLYRTCDAQGVPVETAISEFGPGQVEITLSHRADALRALDEAAMYRRVVKAVAQQHGMLACFMAKPFAVVPGSGMHLHLSLNDTAGNNVFAADDPAGTPLLRHAIGGMAATAAEVMALFAPHGNSYRRYRAYNCAPLAPSWGINNRTVSLRVPGGPAASRHVEHRICGADANPYAVAAAVLAGVHHGIEQQIDPGPPVSGDGYREAGGEPLPQQWTAALDRFAGSAFARRYLGDRFVDVYVAVKRTESDRYYGEITRQDYDWYLHLA